MKKKFRQTLVNDIFYYVLSEIIYIFICLASPTIIKWAASVTASQSESAELTCQSKANPKANVTWYKTGEKNETIFLATDFERSTYYFKEIKDSDKGKYFCRAKNVHGNVTKDVNFIVAGML